jgi:hypothetical protein
VLLHLVREGSGVLPPFGRPGRAGGQVTAAPSGWDCGGSSEGWGAASPRVAALRHAGLLKLFFSELATTEELVALAQAQQAWHREQLVAYQAIMDRYGHRPELARRMAAAHLIYAQAQTWVDFWADIAAHPPIVPPTH